MQLLCQLGLGERVHTSHLASFPSLPVSVGGHAPKKLGIKPGDEAPSHTCMSTHNHLYIHVHVCLDHKLVHVRRLAKQYICVLLVHELPTAHSLPTARASNSTTVNVQVWSSWSFGCMIMLHVHVHKPSTICTCRFSLVWSKKYAKNTIWEPTSFPHFFLVQARNLSLPIPKCTTILICTCSFFFHNGSSGRLRE